MVYKKNTWVRVHIIVKNVEYCIKVHHKVIIIKNRGLKAIVDSTS